MQVLGNSTIYKQNVLIWHALLATVDTLGPLKIEENKDSCWKNVCVCNEDCLCLMNGYSEWRLEFLQW